MMNLPRMFREFVDPDFLRRIGRKFGFVVDMDIDLQLLELRDRGSELGCTASVGSGVSLLDVLDVKSRLEVGRFCFRHVVLVRVFIDNVPASLVPNY